MGDQTYEITREMADALLVAARETADAEPTPKEAALLLALNDATRSLRAYQHELSLEAERRHAESALARTQGQREPAWVSWEKSARQSELEGMIREAKTVMGTCIRGLAIHQTYSRGQIIAAAAGNDPALPQAHRNPATVAIASADLDMAVASIGNNYARRAFFRRYRHGQDDHEIAAALHTDEKAVSRLCNHALDQIEVTLNSKIVADVRARFQNFCLRHGLEFPEYFKLRGLEEG